MRTTKLKIAMSVMALTIGFFTACTESEKKEKEIKVLNEKLVFIESQNDSLNELFANTMVEIDQNLQLVKEKEGIISLDQGDDAEYGNAQREKIIKNIQMINSLMEENKTKLAALSTKLNSSKKDNKSLKKLIHNTEMVLKQKESELAALKTELEKNKYDFQALSAKLRNAEVNNQMLLDYGNKFEKQSYAAYFTCGTYKELEKEGVIKRKGGVLGLGKKASLNSDLKEAEFTKIDTREITSFPFNGNKYELITPHPADSYEIKLNKKDQVSSLEITRPEKFWKTSKYMVLAVKQ